MPIESGKFSAMGGPVGCGNSNIMKRVTGLQFPFKGTIQVAGAFVNLA
jgi:NitT/TauT family transport system ATP-binding protein